MNFPKIFDILIEKLGKLLGLSLKKNKVFWIWKKYLKN